LERYFVGLDENGHQDILHRIIRSDSEPHLHSHPWDADSNILCGWYKEACLVAGVNYQKLHVAGDSNYITRGKVHRIIEAEPNTWTHIKIYSGRATHWYFIDDKGNKTNVKSSPEDWYLDCKPRGIQ
jgi:hypothetical protein